MSAPLVSVALCTWNGARFLPQQLDSLLKQDHAATELVVFDDASTDDTWDILNAWAPRFVQAKLHRNARNLGLRLNFEQAFRACRGEWIAPCDQDDVWEPDKLSTLLKATGGRQTTLAYGDSLLTDEQGRPLVKKPLMSDRYHMVEGSDPRTFALSNCVSGHAAIIRADVMQRALPIPDGAYYDWWIAFVAANLGPLTHVPHPLVRFRQHDANESSAAGQARKRPVKSSQDKFEAHRRNIASLASFDGPDRPFFEQLLQLWDQRARSRFTPALAAFLFRYRHCVFAMKPTPPSAKWRHAIKYLA